jgi:ABC-type amino acid transport substrate-binding protein
VINKAVFNAHLNNDPFLRKQLKALPLVINQQNLYLAFSKKANETKAFPIELISKALAQLRKDGTLTKINEKYLGKRN